MEAFEDITYETLRDVIELLYLGEIEIKENDVVPFLNAIEKLQINGFQSCDDKFICSGNDILAVADLDTQDNGRDVLDVKGYYVVDDSSKIDTAIEESEFNESTSEITQTNDIDCSPTMAESNVVQKGMM